VPPNERQGRVQTSTVTVAVLREPTETEVVLNPNDIDRKTTRGSGPGGQNRNKVETCVVLTYLPTGLSVRCETERSQSQNEERALSLLRARIVEERASAASHAYNESRRSQLGSGMRGDKRRTIRFQDGIVTDHILDRRWRLKDYLRGNFE